MLKEFAQYLVSLKDNKTYEIHGETYSDRELTRVPKYIPRPKCFLVSGLDSVVKVVKTEMNKLTLPVFIRIDSATQVSAYTALDSDMARDKFCEASCDVPGFSDGWLDFDKAIINLRSRFIPNDGTTYLLDLLSRINKESGVSTTDNGVSQTVEARSGIALKSMENINPRVALAPYRTFLEVEQPVSEFLLRLDDNGRVGLFEADGGKWKLDAKANIYSYFSEAFQTEILCDRVVVMM